MVKLKRFDILFNNPERAYFAGQEITGKIVLELAEEKLISEILLELKGRAKTYWTKHSGKSRSHASQNENFFSEQINTNFTHAYDHRMATDGKSIERVIPAGVHEIPFSYTLPKNLPTSFEGEFGFVRYTCRVILERPWDFDIVCYCAFTVIGIEDINCDTEALSPAVASDSNYNVTFCCRKQGTINVELSLSRTGYTPGETILVNGVINNQSQRPIKGSSVQLKQKVNYRAKTFSGTEHLKTVSRLIEKREKGEIPAHSEFRWVDEKIVLPSLTPRLSRCGIIDVTYVLELEADSAVCVQLPVIVGSIPRLSDIIEKAAAASALKATNSSAKSIITSANDDDSRVRVMITDEAGRTVVDNEGHKIEDSDILSTEVEILIQNKKRVRMPSSVLSELYPSLPSPYYRESYFGSVDISDEKETVQFGSPKFAPKYPFYTD
ncbi:Arrestin domain-containing protein 2 [Aphelenchoides besseyi]|nr:Arrestin domain-containing protein 2 [Aphelenchoides besseyi]KAI6201910.1 Arrestin domain-containing protein 2 [Aphelenchoides besseyi]